MMHGEKGIILFEETAIETAKNPNVRIYLHL